MTAARSFQPVVGGEVVLTKYSRVKDRNVFAVMKITKVSATRFTAENAGGKVSFYLSKYNGWQQVVEGGRQNRSVWSSDREWEITTAEAKAESEARYAGQDRTRETARSLANMAGNLHKAFEHLARYPQNLDEETKAKLRAEIAELTVKMESL